MSKTRFIYGLFDPRKPDVVMYVGKTRLSLAARLSLYLGEVRRRRRLGRKMVRPSYKWILKLRDAGVRPRIRLLATTDEKNWMKCERRYIASWRKKNSALLNVHRGGNGIDSNKPKRICDKCGTKRKCTALGKAYCSKCRSAYRRAWAKTPKGRASSARWAKTPKGRAYRRAYFKRRKNVLYKIAWNRSWRQRNREIYNEAARLGTTVTELRARRS